jgi:alkane 1-monooxygenase
MSSTYSNKFDKFLNKRLARKDQPLTESYEELLKNLYKPQPVSGIQTALIVIFVFVPVLAWFFESIFCYAIIFLMIAVAWGEYKVIDREQRNLDDETEARLRDKTYFNYSLYLCLPLLVFNLVVFMAIFNRPDISVIEQIGLLLSAGYTGAVLGINVGHELVHRRSKFEANIGGLLLALVCYATFKVEHVRGHHVYVSTPEDASSAPLGMSLYRFLPRAWIMNPVNGFKLEAKRLRSLGKSPWHWQNELIWWTALSTSFAVLSFMAFGFSGLLFFVAQSFIAITILEVINYVEHYGLERKKLPNGRYERVTHHHSWNASEQATNKILFNLQRHSDHHANPTRPYQILRHFDDSPQLPTGYFGMLYLAFWPKKWFEVMNPRAEAYMEFIRKERERNEGKLERIG